MRRIICISALLFSVSMSAQEKFYVSESIHESAKIDYTGANELTERRTENSATYQFDNGKVIIENSSKPINYKKNGRWERINLEAMNFQQGLLFPNQEHPIFISDIGVVSVDYGGKNSFQYIPYVSEFSAPKLKEVGAAKYELSQGSKRQNFEIRENGVKSSIMIDSFEGNQNEELRLTETFLLPKNGKVVFAEGRGTLKEGKWFGSLIITDGSGICIGTIGGAICIDANKKFELAGYEILNTGDTWKVTTVINSDWLSQQERAFPVEVDPLVTGPTSLWTNGYMPSCFMPAYNVDSLLVTVPGGITVTGLLVGASYYADPFTAAWMSDGSMYFSTTCGQTQEFTVTGANANLAGTAYLENFDMRNPLMCCYTPTCTDQSFYLRMHLGRSYINDGCNTNYIYYDLFTQWPFTAYIEGHTVETYGSEWTVPTGQKCTNDCSVVGTIRIRYGIPPYTITHPWMQGSVIAGTAEPCDLGNTAKQLPLTIPNCPEYCNTSPTLSIPPPTVTDACGNTIAGLTPATLNRKPAPDVTATPTNLIVCNNELYDISLNSCLSGATITWGGNGDVSTGSFSDQFFVADTVAVDVTYSAFADLNGCYSDTITFAVQVQPTPSGSFEVLPNPVVVGMNAQLTDNTNTYGSAISLVEWDFNDGSTGVGQTVEHAFNLPGTYLVCETVTTEFDCSSEICQEVIVVPATIKPVNIMTPNNDGQNETLAFEFLEFYPENELKVFNRWGTLIYEKKGYDNSWTANGFSDGTYFYILYINTEQPPIESDLYIKRD